jgi:hypothetical protein
MRNAAIVGAVALTLGASAQAAPVEKPLTEDTPAPIEVVVIHRLFSGYFTCSEHYAGELPHLGDALGSDCMVLDSLAPGEDENGWFAKLYRTNGKTNEDWYGWGVPVLAPFDGAVEDVHVNPVTNATGTINPKPASRIVFSRADGTHVMFGHVADITVAKGDKVRAGQPVAKVGNNGYGRAPHIHIGAWRGKQPLQIRFDLHSK